MSVDVAPQPVAPQPPATVPAEAEERVHTGLFWLALVNILIGAMLIGASRVWAAQAPKMVTFPLFNQTSVMSGTLTYHVDPGSLVPLQTPAASSFNDVRHVQTPGLVAFREMLVSTDTVTVSGGGRTTLAAQYLVDTRTLHHLASPQAWSFTGSNVADRSAAYSVNLPIDGGPGPFQIWLNEADRSYTFRQTGQLFSNGDLAVRRLQAHLDATPVDPAFIADLSRAGVPAGKTVEQLQTAVEALGVHVDGAFPPMPSALSTDEVATLLAPIPLDYTMSGEMTLLVEPRTGSIVSVQRMAENFTAHLDAARLRAVAAVALNHRTAPGMQTLLAATTRLAAVADAPAFDLSYAQTPASVRTVSSYAATQRDWINRMTRVIPTTLFAAGLGLIAAGALCGFIAWRRRDAVSAYWWEED